jgi:Leucine-rich repeat (LRR) protein
MLMVLGTLQWGFSSAQSLTVYTDLKKANRDPEKVEILDLSGKGMKKFSEELKNFTNLRELNLSGNCFVTIPAWIEKCEKLEVLKLEVACLESIPTQLANLEKLKELSLLGNKLQKLDLELNRLNKLEKLNLSVCFLKEIPRLDSLTGLNALVIHANFLSELPIGIENLKNLEVLDMSANPFDRASFEIGKLISLKKLRHFQVAGLGLTTVPDAVFEITSLQFLNLTDNLLTELNLEGFRKLIHLDRVWLYGSVPPLEVKDISALKRVLPRKCAISYQRSYTN